MSPCKTLPIGTPRPPPPPTSPHQPPELSNAFGSHSSAVLSQLSLPPILLACGGIQSAQPLTCQLLALQCRVQCPAWMCWQALLLSPSPNWVPPVALTYSLQVKLHHFLHEQSSFLTKLNCLLIKLDCLLMKLACLLMKLACLLMKLACLLMKLDCLLIRPTQSEYLSQI